MPVLKLDPPGPPHPGAETGGTQGPDRPVPAGVQRPDPRTIGLDRTINAIVGAVLAAGHLLVCGILWLVAAWPRWGLIAVSLSWFPVTGLLAWLALRWPAIDYAYRRYQVTSDGIQIWSGVLWRTVIAVPRSRVQHIDVTQGPIERSYGLATLSIYTAGSEYSKVDLPGLDHAVALTLRDTLLPQHADPAV